MINQRGVSTIDLMLVATACVMLVAVAVPRFAYLSEEARVEAVKNLSDEVRAAAELTNRVWQSAGKPENLTTNGEVLQLAHGFPTEGSVNAVVIDDSEFEFDRGAWHYRQDGKRVKDCAVFYQPPPNEFSRPVVSANVEGC